MRGFWLTTTRWDSNMSMSKTALLGVPFEFFERRRPAHSVEELVLGHLLASSFVGSRTIDGRFSTVQLWATARGTRA